SRRRHTRFSRDWSSDVCSSDLGVGSATFHPEASRVARLASGGRFGTAQSTFQVGGNTGSALGPLLAAAIVIPHGQPAIAWFMVRSEERRVGKESCAPWSAVA